MLDRRNFLVAGGLGTATLVANPRLAWAKAGTDKRFLFIIQRGAADGLAILAPIGDPAYIGLRGELARDAASGTRLDAMFTLHPALATSASLYAAKQALFVHAIASPYRDRSHFDGQNILESGAAGAYRLKDGWMNRLLSQLPGDRAIALSPAVPRALRGPGPVESYAPSALPDAADDLMLRVGDLYAHDAQLGPLWTQALAARIKAGDVSGAKGGAALGALAARQMSGVDGARIAMIETNGWDTHSGQTFRLAAQLKQLDLTIGAFRDGLGPEWRNTLVLVATEFGRTAKANGTGGTDHGTGAMAMLFGGALAGGRVLADWPGLSPNALYEGRDLKPTIGLDALVAGALAEHFGLDPARAMAVLFPQTSAAPFAQKLFLS
ncbi:MAG: DUF1501 domain-containing protein [Sphingomicrobium sp.]